MKIEFARYLANLWKIYQKEENNKKIKLKTHTNLTSVSLQFKIYMGEKNDI